MRPFEADRGDAGADLVGPGQRRHRFRHTGEQRLLLALALLFARLDLFPLLDDRARRRDAGGVAEDMRMPPNQFGADVFAASR